LQAIPPSAFSAYLGLLRRTRVSILHAKPYSSPHLYYNLPQGGRCAPNAKKNAKRFTEMPHCPGPIRPAAGGTEHPCPEVLYDPTVYTILQVAIIRGELVTTRGGPRVPGRLHAGSRRCMADPRMQDLVYELPRIHIPRTSVNKGMKKGPEGCYTALFEGL
jgi:hypothetical protein